MRGYYQGVLLLGMLTLGIQPPAVHAQDADVKAAPAQPGYSSPHEAFEARRKALARRDWRTVFASSTPEVQDWEAWGLWHAWVWIEEGMEGGPFDGFSEADRLAEMAKARAVMKKHGVALPDVKAEHDKKYLAAHGVDRAKLKAEMLKRGRERMEEFLKKHPNRQEAIDEYLKKHPDDVDYAMFLPPGPSEKPDPPLPEIDEKLLDSIMITRITNKAVFYEEAMECLTPKVKEKSGYDDVFGDLKGLVVAGDSAKGWILWNRSQMVNGTRDVFKPVRVLRKFRRLNGRWYNDDFSEELTHYDDADAETPRGSPIGAFDREE